MHCIMHGAGMTYVARWRPHRCQLTVHVGHNTRCEAVAFIIARYPHSSALQVECMHHELMCKICETLRYSTLKDMANAATQLLVTREKRLELVIPLL